MALKFGFDMTTKARAVLLELYAPDVYKTEDRYRRQYNKLVIGMKINGGVIVRVALPNRGGRSSRPTLSLHLTCSRNINETPFRCDGI